ncbi:hypothetical protein BDP55DRAFT_687026, partial [Colletotrichum godetiae]
RAHSTQTVVPRQPSRVVRCAVHVRCCVVACRPGTPIRARDNSLDAWRHGNWAHVTVIWVTIGLIFVGPSEESSDRCDYTRPRPGAVSSSSLNLSQGLCRVDIRRARWAQSRSDSAPTFNFGACIIISGLGLARLRCLVGPLRCDRLHFGLGGKVCCSTVLRFTRNRLPAGRRRLRFSLPVISSSGPEVAVANLECQLHIVELHGVSGTVT